MLEFILGIIVAWAIAAFPIYNLLKKVEQYEDFFSELTVQLQKTIAQMRYVDIRGAFEADDEIGAAFQSILRAIESLTPFVVISEENNEETPN